MRPAGVDKLRRDKRCPYRQWSLSRVAQRAEKIARHDAPGEDEIVEQEVQKGGKDPLTLLNEWDEKEKQYVHDHRDELLEGLTSALDSALRMLRDGQEIHPSQ